MTVRLLPKTNGFRRTVETAVLRDIDIYSLRRTDEFLVVIKWFDVVNHPLSLRASRWGEYINALRATEKTIVIFDLRPTIPNYDNGILIAPTDQEGVILHHMVGNQEVGQPLRVTRGELLAHREHVIEMATFLTSASQNTKYPIIEA